MPIPPSPPGGTGPYSYQSLAQARQELANRLYDSSMQFWTAAELTLLIQWGLRIWNSLTGFWRNDFLFDAAQGVTWYDLTDNLTLPHTLRPLTVEDVDIYNWLEYALLEPVTGGAPWTGSGQFTLDDLQQAVARRRDEILSETGCYITRNVLPALPGRTVLSDSVIDIRRAAWLPASAYQNSPLWAGDAWEAESFEPGYTVGSGQPQIYLESTQPPVSFDVDTAPAVPGQYEVLTVNAGPSLPQATPQLFTIPDDFCWLVYFGALADLFGRETNAKDVLRQKYCEARYREGLAVLSVAPALLQLRVNNIPILVDGVKSADSYDPLWQAAAQGTPNSGFTAGLNLVALNPPPDAGSYSMTATVVENAPIPEVDADKVQLAREDYDALLDECQHIAMLKAGGQEFADTIILHQRFMAQAKLYNGKLAELGEYQTYIYQLSEREKQLNPIMAADSAQSS